jgi:hypothetical protein
MRELVRLAGKKVDIRHARAEAIRCAGEAIEAAKADEGVARRLGLFTHAMRNKWSRVRSSTKESPYNWQGIIEYWQGEGCWDQVARHTKVAGT